MRGEVSWGSEGKIGLDGLYFSAPGENATVLFCGLETWLSQEINADDHHVH